MARASPSSYARTVSARRPQVLLGRAGECELLDRLLANVRGGQSAVLVIRGDAGIGKTALLHYCARQASEFRIARIAGVEAEMELPFAAIHQLCGPLLGRLDVLPEPQQRALAVALGLSSGKAPDRFLVALAVLSLLSAVAEERPLLCLVDDAHWLDDASSQVLGFVARRLLAESVATVFAVREAGNIRAFDGLPELPLEGLDEQGARALLAWAVPRRLDERIRDRIVAETAGNPLALLELPRVMSAAELAGGFDLPGAGGLPGHLENHYLQRIGALPEATQRLLLLAAADPAGDAVLIWRAAQQLGIGSGALAPAVDAQLMSIGEQVRFRHPLVRSAAYGTASPAARQEAHRVLAELTDPQHDPDRRAWHRALAATSPDEDVAAELERSAERAQMRGGLAAAAAFLERAAELTPDAGPRVGRALGAAEVKYRCGEADAALRLLGQVDAGPLNALQRARVHLLRGETFFSSHRRGEAPPLLLLAARELEPLDPLLSRDTYLDALSAALVVGQLAGEVGLSEVAQAARAAPANPGSSVRPQDLLLDGLAVVITEGYVAGAPLLKEAVSAFRNTDIPVVEAMRWLWPATHAAYDLWDDESWDELSARRVTLARETGALSVLPIALRARVGFHLFAGELASAASLSDEIEAVTKATGGGHARYRALALAAFSGRESEAAALIHAASSDLVGRSDGMGLTLIEHAKAVLYNGLGRYREACEAARRGAAHPRELAISNWSLPHLVEAAVRTDQRALAEDAMRRLARTTAPSGTDWALGVESRCRALVSDGDEAEGYYRDAIDHLGRTRLRAEHARGHLLYGEWLRRQAHHVEARTHLRTAHDMFGDMGMEAFTKRARRERLATGESIRKRRTERRDKLTPQEAQIAQLARAGLTNPEIGGQLFLSPRTVEWHLKKIFTKLGISSRRGLPDALSSPDREATIA
jgi:DNA-binding CsgD family transcriptional regulator